MKKFSLLILVMILCSSAYASDCRVVETEDKVEVICEGVPEVKKPEAKAATVNPSMSERSSIELAVSEERANLARSAELVKNKKKELEDLNEWTRKGMEDYQKSIGK